MTPFRGTFNYIGSKWGSNDNNNNNNNNNNNDNDNDSITGREMITLKEKVKGILSRFGGIQIKDEWAQWKL